MRNIFLAGAALMLLSGAALADDQVKKDVGTAGGALGGAAAGAVVGGPVGAVVGGVAGAIIGSNASVPDHVRTYVVEHPVDEVAIDGDLSDDYAFSDDVRIHEIPDYPDYGYVYVQHRPVVVKLKTRKVVYVPAGE